MENAVFAVDDEPYCLWDPQLRERNKEFLSTLDPGYFEYCLHAHQASQDSKYAPLALKIALHHAVETLFSLLGAFTQSPRNAYAWIAKCSNTQLRSLTGRISSGDTELITTVVLPSISWSGVAKAVMQDYLPGTDRNSQTVELFGKLWERLAHELTNVEQIDEYNAIKHGFRVSTGEFGLRADIEHEYGIPPPDDEMQLIGHSQFGTSFFKIDRVGSERSSRSVKVRRVAVNWSYERVALLLQLTYMSINNVISALRSVNGFPKNECEYLRPEDDIDFDKPWRHPVGILSMKLDYVVDESSIRSTTKDELLAILRARK